MPRLRSLLAPLALIGGGLLAGCDALTYEPNGENAVDLPAAEPLEIDLAAAADTLVLWGEVDLDYRAVTRGGLREVGAYVGERLVATAREGEPLRVHTHGIPDGTYQLRVVAAAGTGTGSLADRLGLEVATAVTERVAVIENTGPASPTVTLREEGGVLAVSWSPTTSRRFSHYEVQRYGLTQWSSLDVRDRNATRWVDSTYIGGEVTYTVRVWTGAGATDGTARAAYPLPRLTRAEPVAEGRIALEWSTTAFPGAFRQYVVRRLSNARQDGAETVTFDDVMARSFTDRVDADVFGEQLTYELATIPTTGGEDVRFGPGLSTFARPGVQIVPQAYLPATGTWVGAVHDNAASETRLLAYSEGGGTRSLGAVPEGTQAVGSASGRRLFTAEGAQLRERDPASLAVTQTLGLDGLLGRGGRIGTPAVATDDGLLLFNLSRVEGYSAYYGIGAGVLDVTAPRYEGRVTIADAWGEYGTLEGGTDDGRFFAVSYGSQRYLYRRAGAGEFVRVRELPRRVVFFGDRAAQLDGSTVSVLTLPDLAPERTFPVAFGLINLRYDAGAGWLYGHTATGAPTDHSKTVIAYDPATGREMGRVPVVDMLAGFGRDGSAFVVLGGRIWWNGLTQRLSPPNA